MIRYVLTWPGMLNQQAMDRAQAMLDQVASSPRWRDVVLPAGATLVRLNELPVPSVAARRAQKRLR